MSKNIAAEVKNVLNGILEKLGIQILTLEHFHEVKNQSQMFLKQSHWIHHSEVPIALRMHVLENLLDSYSQVAQDLIASFLNQGRNGYFVEFGAADGVTGSNTYLLEKQGWKGILADPNRSYSKQLQHVRSSHVELVCISGKSGEELEFIENGLLSKVGVIENQDLTLRLRNKNRTYKVPTLSLEALLDKWEAPQNIEFISIDTEGTEVEILEKFDFKKYNVQYFVVEHNYGENGIKLDKIFESNGYTRVLRSSALFDAWYVKNDHWSIDLVFKLDEGTNFSRDSSSENN
jgi:FkbM family methyltransferase